MFVTQPLMPQPRLLQTRNPNLLQARIICDGNSITQGAEGPETAYPRQLERLLNQLGYDVEVLNIGVSGQTTAQMLNDAPRQLDRLYTPDRPCWVIAKEGGNHIFYGATVPDAFATFAEYCQGRRSRGFRVVAIDTFPRKNGYFPGDERVADYAADLVTYNQLIQANWRSFADLYFDARSQLPELDMRAPYMTDGVHPTIEGNALFAARMATFLVQNAS
jgi:lysophospholipase L1-like esterase